MQAQVKLLRHPTYSKGKVAFSYLGDIWIANDNGTGAERLTDNAARDQFPRFSPDGSWVAFSRTAMATMTSSSSRLPAASRASLPSTLPPITWSAG